MKIHPVVTHQNSIVSVQMQATFVGDVTDATDKQRIAAYGDPEVNLAGLFTDPGDSTFRFQFQTSQKFVGITTEMLNITARFMSSVPVGIDQQPLDCIVSNSIRAATIWAAAIETACGSAMTALRAKTPVQLTSLSDATV